MPIVMLTDEQFQKLLDADARDRKSDFNAINTAQCARDERDCARTDALLADMRMVREYREFERVTRKTALMLQALETIAIIIIAAILYIGK